jgi:arabinofuranosyltransferase
LNPQAVAAATRQSSRLSGRLEQCVTTLSAWGTAATQPLAARENTRARALSYACVACLAAAFAWRILSRAEAYDDAYITYRFARNLAAGSGLRWNPTDALPVYGASSLPWALLLGLGAKLQLPPPALALALQGISHVALSSLAISLVPSLVPGLLAGCLVALGYPLLAQGQGLEIELFAALCLFAVKLAVQRRFGWAGFIAGLATAVRLDGLSVLAVVALACLFEPDRWRAGFRAARGAIVPLSASLVTALWIFGDPVPQSMRAKMVSAVHPRWTFHSFFDHWLEQPVVATCIVLIALVLFVGRSREFRVLAAWLALHVLEYKLTGMPGYGWYYSAPTVALCILPFSGVVDLRRALALHLPRRLAFGLLLGLALPVGLAAKAARDALRMPPVTTSPHAEAAHWIAGHTRLTDKVLAYEIGKVGYLADRATIDMFGLVSPEVVPSLRVGGMAEVVRTTPFDYLFTRRDLPLPKGRALEEVWASADGVYMVLKQAPGD